ncbi:MAG: hypothetical protein IRZ08_20985 [Frankia sp.]|nr:hypothetical protein [Frankia sp.]
MTPAGPQGSPGPAPGPAPRPPGRRWPRVLSRGPLALTVVVAGTAGIGLAAAKPPEHVTALAPPGQPVPAATVFRQALPPSSRTLVCPDLGAASRMTTQIDLARSGRGGQVDAAFVDGGQPAFERPAEPAAQPERDPAPRPAGVLDPAAPRASLRLRGLDLPPRPPEPEPGDLSALVLLPPDDLAAIKELRAEEDRRRSEALEYLAGLPPADRDAIVALAEASDPDEPAAEPAGQPVILSASRVARLSATATAPDAAVGPIRARCQPARGQAWFAGPATVAGRDPIAVWVNLGSAPARVAVTALAPGRPATVTEVAVPPGATVTRRVAEFAPEAPATVIGVETRTGQVASWLIDRPNDAAPRQIVPVPQTALSAGSVLLGPLIAPPGDGGAPAELVLATPAAAADTRVRVRLLTATGDPATPAGLDDVPLPGREARTIQLALPRGEAVSVLVEPVGGAAGPLAAGLAVPAGGAAPAGSAGGAAAGGSADGARLWVAGSAVAAQPAAGGQFEPYADVPPIPDEAVGAVALTAVAAPVTARVDDRVIEVPAGRSVAVPLPGGYPGGQLRLAGGPAAVTQLLGPAPDDPDAPGPVVRALSSVLVLGPADPPAPLLLVEDPALLDVGADDRQARLSASAAMANVW